MHQYAVIERVAPLDDFLRLREIAGLTPRAREAAALALPNSYCGVHVRHDGQVIAMGRVVGDGGLNFEIVDIAVDPAFQRRGLGREIMTCLLVQLRCKAPAGAYVTLMADVPALYEKFGFELTRPVSEGMALTL